MLPSDLEQRERELERRIVLKEREIGEDIEAIRAAARQVSNTAVALTVGTGVLMVGLFVAWQAVRALRRSRGHQEGWGRSRRHHRSRYRSR